MAGYQVETSFDLMRCEFEELHEGIFRGHIVDGHMLHNISHFLTFNRWVGWCLSPKSTGRYQTIIPDCSVTVSQGGVWLNLSEKADSEVSHCKSWSSLHPQEFSLQTGLRWYRLHFLQLNPVLPDSLMNFISIVFNTSFVFLLAPLSW